MEETSALDVLKEWLITMSYGNRFKSHAFAWSRRDSEIRGMNAPWLSRGFHYY